MSVKGQDKNTNAILEAKEDGSTFFRNANTSLPDYTASYPRRIRAYSYTYCCDKFMYYKIGRKDSTFGYLT